MVRYSHVSLMIPCEIDDIGKITGQLGFQPSRIQESKIMSRQKDGNLQEVIARTWMLDSPKDANVDLTGRLHALADKIKPISDRLLALDSCHKRWIDIVYHVTPQHAHGITGEFDWFRMPANLMGQFASWNLGISYEVFWFDHPEWKGSRHRTLWQNLFSSLSK